MPYNELTRSIVETIAGLDTRKGRKKTGLFKAEGEKCVADTMGHFSLEMLVATGEWIDRHPKIHGAIQAGPGKLREMSSLSTPADVIAVYRIPEPEPLPEPGLGLMLALDTIQDPGNLGTIIRVADWFGVEHILCSQQTVSCYSPKVIQATMGSISRVRLHYCNLPETLSAMKTKAAECGKDFPVYGTFLDGTPIGNASLMNEGMIIIGNEGNGISPEVAETVSHRLLIPSWPEGRPTGESLNAAIATAITLAKFRGI